MPDLSVPPDWEDPPRNDYSERAIQFYGALPHIKGKYANRGLTLGDTWEEYPERTRWQRRLVRHVFGKVDSRGDRLIRVVYLEIPKKNGKTFLAAGTGLYLTFLDGEEGAEVYSAAYVKDQAKLAWKTAYKQVERMPALRERAELYDYPARTEIEYPAKNSVYKPIARDAKTAEGVNPHGVIFDELHTQRDSALWDNLNEAMGSRHQPLLWSITTAGHDRETVCYRQREYTKRVNVGDVDDETHFGVIFAADREDDWQDPEVWRAANPNLGVSVEEDQFAASANKAANVPTKLNSFLRYRLNVWTRSVTRWIDPDVWEKAGREIDWEEYRGRPCYGGLDLGSVSDLTAWVLAFPDPDDPDTVDLKCLAWCPEYALDDAENPHRDNYMVWVRQGWLKTTPGRVTDYRAVQRQIRADAKSFGLVDMAVDAAFQGNQLIVELMDEGFNVMSMRTTYTDMTDPTNEFERRLLMDPPRIRHDGNPVLAWAVQNVALRQPDPDRRRPVKDTEEAKIDPVVASLMALSRAMRHETGESRESAYNDPEKEMLVL